MGTFWEIANRDDQMRVMLSPWAFEQPAEHSAVEVGVDLAVAAVAVADDKKEVANKSITLPGQYNMFNIMFGDKPNQEQLSPKLTSDFKIFLANEIRRVFHANL